jgi:hypothetical protein
MPAGENRVLGLERVELVSPRVGDFHFLGAGGDAQMLYANCGAVQPYADGRTGIVKFRVVRFGQDNV